MAAPRRPSDPPLVGAAPAVATSRPGTSYDALGDLDRFAADDGVDVEALRHSRHRRQILQRAILALFAAAIIALLLGAWPFAEAALDAPDVVAAKPGIARVVRARGWAVGPGPEGDGGRLSAGEGRERLPSKLFETLLENESDDAVGRRAMARGPLELRDSASLSASTTVTVKPNTPLLVLRDAGGDWIQLAFRDEDRTIIGWATREQVILLP